MNCNFLTFRIPVVPVYCILTFFYCCTIRPLHAQNAATALAPPSVIFEALALNHDIPTKKKPKYRSPTALVPSPDGKRMYIAEQTAKRIAVYNLETKSLKAPILLPNEVTGIALSPDGSTLYATCGSAIWPEGMVCVVDAASGKVTHRISDGIGFMPRSPVLSPDGLNLYVCNRFSNSLSVVNTATQNVTDTVALPREPYASAITPDGKRLIIGNLISRDRATDTTVISCEVTIFDTENNTVLKSIRLIPGSKSIHDVCVSPDGRYAFVSHLIGRFKGRGETVILGNLQTNNLSIIDIGSMLFINSISLDFEYLGMADPWAVQFATDDLPSDSAFLLITNAGGNYISMIHYDSFIDKIEAATNEGIDLQNKFTYLLEDVRGIIASELTGLRSLAVIGRKFFTAGYFDDGNPVMAEYPVNPLYYTSAKMYETVSYHSIGATQPVTGERRGEYSFHNAKLCAQEWQSCQYCHPFGRTDGLNWILNSTIAGTPKNTKSMLYSWWTPPGTWTGRWHAKHNIRAGIQLELFLTPAESLALPIDTFFMYMKPAASPYLEKGRFSESAQRGKQLFNDPEKGGCSVCHKGPLFSDKKSYNVGVEDIFDQSAINTPHLAETWRTAPYSHLGSILDVKDILDIDAHTGIPKKIAEGTMTAAQIDDLVAYVLSL